MKTWLLIVLVLIAGVVALKFYFIKNTVVDNENNIEPAGEITVTEPRPGQHILSPLLISGQARGSWYFEANFPVELRDGNGTLLAQGAAHAQGNWMTDNFVPFSAELLFTTPVTSTGELILHNDNPSGLPENEKSVTVPILFK